MRYYLIAGERSGDLHGSSLVKKLKDKDPEALFRGFGGDLMVEAGMDLVFHYRDIAVMGLIEVIVNLNKISSYLKNCKKDILEFKPDVIILIDYAGFNLRIAKFAKKNTFKVFYYISPKIWAWKTSRVWKLKAYVDRIFVILPFEVEFFKKYGVKSDYVGNPVLDAVKTHPVNRDFLAQNQISNEQQIIALLPGSRNQELKRILPEMVNVANDFKQNIFIVAAVDNLPQDLYDCAREHINIKLVYEQAYDLLAHAHAAIVTSGTATLETALWKVPQVVLYKTHPVTYEVGRRMVFKNIDYFSLVNLIAGKEVVKELLQREANTENISYALELILSENERSKIQDSYKEIVTKLGEYNAAERASELMIEDLKTTQP